MLKIPHRDTEHSMKPLNEFWKKKQKNPAGKTEPLLFSLCVFVFHSCRFLYNRSGEWSDGTVPILATTAAGFTYIAFLMVCPSNTTDFVLSRRLCSHVSNVLPNKKNMMMMMLSKSRSVRQMFLLMFPLSLFFHLFVCVFLFVSGFSTLPHCTRAAVKFALAS